ncbi:MAG TPA: hypothetical protein VK009_17360 [Chloroflexota bacterium]|nr:hypothetical protein [Chloroflexota bacterium]
MTAEQLPLGLDEGSGGAGAPAFVTPMRAQPVAEPFDSPDYLFETRWGGIRALVAIAGGGVRLHSRRLGDLTSRFPELRLLAYAAAEQPLLLDGEIVIVDERGHPQFDTPQWRLRLVDEQLIAAEALRHPACFLASDLLYRGQRWLLRDPLQRRKRQLAEALHQSDCLYLAEYFEAEGRALYEAAVESQLEGILAKPRDGLYTPGGFGGGWLAVGRERETLVVGGCSMQIAGGRRTMDLLLGGYDASGRLIFVSAVQPPDDDALQADLLRVLNALQVDQPPFAETPPYIGFWVRPELVVSVSFNRRSGKPTFERVRLDVPPDECLLAADAPLPARPSREERPRLTMLTTMALPLDISSEPAPPRPALRLLDDAS